MNKLRIYSTESCAFCKRAVELLESKGLKQDQDFEYIDVTSQGNEMHMDFLRENNLKTVPQIFEWDDEQYQFSRHIGGFIQLKEEIE